MQIYHLHKDWLCFKDCSLVYMVLMMICQMLNVCEIEMTKIKMIESKLNFSVSSWEKLLGLDFIDVSLCIIIYQ